VVTTERAQAVVCDNPDQHRYELLIGDSVVGEIQYHHRRSSDRIAFIHTEVSPELGGHGLASKLVAGALDDVRTHGLRVVPICPFVCTYLRRHPEYEDLVVPDRRVRH
jgi:predicted GNAT family acetyltransferase